MSLKPTQSHMWPATVRLLSFLLPQAIEMASISPGRRYDCQEHAGRGQEEEASMERREGLRHLHADQVLLTMVLPASSLTPCSSYIPKSSVSDPHNLNLTLKVSPVVSRRGRRADRVARTGQRRHEARR